MMPRRCAPRSHRPSPWPKGSRASWDRSNVSVYALPGAPFDFLRLSATAFIAVIDTWFRLA